MPGSAAPPLKGYPFITRRDVAKRLSIDTTFVRQCVALLQERYERRLELEPPCGWMASHRSRGCALAARAADGQATELELIEAGRSWLASYARQVAMVLRARKLEEEPGLAVRAAAFGVGPAADAERQSRAPSRRMAEFDVDDAMLPPPPDTAGPTACETLAQPPQEAAATEPEETPPAGTAPEREPEPEAEPAPATPAPATPPSPRRPRPRGLAGRMLALVDASDGGVRFDQLVKDRGIDSAVASATVGALASAGWVERMGRGRWAMIRKAT